MTKKLIESLSGMLNKNFARGFMFGWASHSSFNHFYSKMDTNGDNKIDNNEIVNAISDKLKSVDKNNDNVIDVSEITDEMTDQIKSA